MLQWQTVFVCFIIVKEVDDDMMMSRVKFNTL